MEQKQLSEFLKLWSKKDLYGLIQDREKIIADKDQLICECNKQLVELQEENAKLKEEKTKLKDQIKQLNKDWKRDVRELEYALLNTEEQLQNAIVPKFKYHQVVYAVANTDILKGQIDVFDIYQKKYLVHFYGIDDINSFGDMWCYENELFATEAEAQKYLEERK